MAKKRINLPAMAYPRITCRPLAVRLPAAGNPGNYGNPGLARPNQAP
jgi:hypothetical protein